MVKTALVLGGGGARGSYEMGVWKALREMNIEIHMVTGTSIGAINGAAIAQGDFDLAMKLWDIIETSHVFDININENISLDKKITKTYHNFIINALKKGGTELNALKNTLISFIDEKAIRDSNIEFGLVTYEIDTKKPHELFVSDIPNGELIEYILASASIYPVIRPHVIKNVRFIDGAYYDNLPIKMAIEKGANNIIAVDLNAFGVINNESLYMSEKLTYIKSYWNLGPTLVFDREEIRRNFRLGYLDTFKAFDIYEGFAFTFYSGFCQEVENKFSHLLPLEDLIQKSGDEVINQFFMKYVEKVIKDRCIHNSDVHSIGLICAELAGEIFELSNEVIYSPEVWLSIIRNKIQELKSSNNDDFNKAIFDNSIIDTMKTLTCKKLKSIYVSEVVIGLSKDILYKNTFINLTVTPEIFLSGIYLASIQK